MKMHIHIDHHQHEIIDFFVSYCGPQHGFDRLHCRPQFRNPGGIDIPAVIRSLIDSGFDGVASFEYEKDAKDPLAGLAESVGYVRGVLATLTA